ncbi:hypothetical protein ACFQWH_22765 [Mycolicibacterium sp. GCM10028919]|uniref:hypothetical protein n=1 Tax=Mycolicibacterium sp. GCM10028919 TaxID=3273401 RepID=UPI003609FF61
MTSDRGMAEWDAAYLLGALTAEEAAEYERYLANSPRRAELSDADDIPGILDVLTPEEALALIEEGPKSEVRGEVAAQPTSLGAAAERRRLRSRRARLAGALASAAAFLLVGGIVGYAVIPHEPSSTTGVSLQAMAAGEREGVSASLAVSEEPWGTRLDWQCEYTKAWASNVKGYDLVVMTKDGSESTVASWRPSGDEATNLAAATVIPTSDIRSVVIREAGTATPLAVTTLT